MRQSREMHRLTIYSLRLASLSSNNDECAGYHLSMNSSRARQHPCSRFLQELFFGGLHTAAERRSESRAGVVLKTTSLENPIRLTRLALESITYVQIMCYRDQNQSVGRRVGNTRCALLPSRQLSFHARLPFLSIDLSAYLWPPLFASIASRPISPLTARSDVLFAHCGGGERAASSNASCGRWRRETPNVSLAGKMPMVMSSCLHVN